MVIKEVKKSKCSQTAKEIVEKKILSNTKPSVFPSLVPGKVINLCNGTDIKKKNSNRKSKYLFSFPGLISPIEGGGEFGTLEKLDTEHPVCYINYPNGGRMKMIGTIVYPKNKYLTLQCQQSGKKVVGEDLFDAIVTFPQVSWIGSKQENPDENPLPFPKEIEVPVEESDKIDFQFNSCGAQENQTVSPNPSEDSAEQDSSIVVEASENSDVSANKVVSKKSFSSKKKQVVDSDSNGDSDFDGVVAEDKKSQGTRRASIRSRRSSTSNSISYADTLSASESSKSEDDDEANHDNEDDNGGEDNKSSGKSIGKKRRLSSAKAKKPSKIARTTPRTKVKSAVVTAASQSRTRRTPTRGTNNAVSYASLKSSSDEETDTSKIKKNIAESEEEFHDDASSDEDYLD